MANKKEEKYEIEVIDEEDYNVGSGGGDSLSIRTIILNHIERISRFIFKSSSEPDYKESSGGGSLVKTSDPREVIIAAIEFLKSLLQPHYDKEMIDKQKKIGESIKALEEDLRLASIEKESMLRSKNVREPEKAYHHWRKTLAEAKVGFFDKDSLEYEYFLYAKYQLMMELFSEMLYLWKRIKSMLEQDYNE